MRAVTCFIVENNELLLQERPHGKVWGGLLNGPGGKIEPGETSLDAVVREVKEETNLDIMEPEFRGSVLLHIPVPKALTVEVDIFVAQGCSGEAMEKEGKLGWYPIDQLPYSRLWRDQKYWLPAVLDGYHVKAEIFYENETLHLERFDIRVTEESQRG